MSLAGPDGPDVRSTIICKLIWTDPKCAAHKQEIAVLPNERVVDSLRQQLKGSLKDGRVVATVDGTPLVIKSMRPAQHHDRNRIHCESIWQRETIWDDNAPGKQEFSGSDLEKTWG